MTEQVLFFSASVAVVVAAAASTNLLMPNREPWKRLLAAFSAVSVLVVSLLLLLGTVGSLSAPSAVIAMIILAVVLTVASRIVNTRSAPVPAEHFKLKTPAPRGASWYITAGILGGLWGAFTVVGVFGGTQFISDDLIYHATAVAEWVQNGRLSFAPQTYQAYYPKNAEVFSLWFVLLVHGDGLASLAGWYWVTLGVLAIMTLCRIAGGTAATAILAAALFVAAGPVTYQGWKFSAVDVAGPAAMLASLALALPSGSVKLKERLVDALYSGLILGLAIGTKVSFAPAGLILAAVFASRYGTQGNRKMRVAIVAVFSASAVMTGGYWYLQNMILTGNPIYPAEFGPFAGPFGRADQYKTTMLRALVEAGGNLEHWKIIARHYLGWGFGLGLLALAGYGMALCSWCRQRISGASELNGRLKIILVLGITLLVLHPLMPFSGAIDRPDVTLIPQPRFLIGPFAIGLILFASIAETSTVLKKILIPIAVLAIVQKWIRPFPDNSWMIVLRCTLGVGVGVALYLIARLNLIARLTAQIRIRYIAAGGVLTAVAVIAAYAPYKQALTDNNIHTYAHRRGNPFAGSAWKLLGMVPDGARVAAFGPRMWMYYPLFGRRFQLVPCPGNKNAAAYVHYHQRPPGTVWWWHTEGTKFNPETFRVNLINRGVQYVLTTKGQAPEWPIQHHALAKWGAAELIHEDVRSALWRIRNGG